MEEMRASRAGKVRRAKACNTCRRKKVKCDGKRPICSSCNTFNLSCTFLDVVEHSNRSNRAYIEELERQVQSMKEQLQRVNRSGREPQRSVDDPRDSLPPATGVRCGSECSQSEYRADGNPFAGPAQRLEEKDLHGSAEGEGYGDEIDQPSCVINTNDGKMRFFGASSGFCVPLAQRVNGLESRAWTATWQSAVQQGANRWQLTNWLPRIFQDSFERQIVQALPCKEMTEQLAGEFFTKFNQAMPLCDEPSFMRLLERQYSWNPDDSPSWWVLLNVVLAFSYRERAQAASGGSDDWKRSLGHIKNALNVVVELFLRNTDLLAVQGLLGLALYFQGTPNPQALFMFAAAAMRLSQSIGLHRSNTSGLTPSRIEERRRTYWIAFILDADISIRVGRPPVQDLGDYNTPLPAKLPRDGKGIISVNGIQINFFRLLTQFAMVQRRVYQRLYTIAVHRQPREKVITEVKACEEDLLRWKSSFPVILEPQHAFVTEPHYFQKHLLRLHFAYHSCYANLHQVCMSTAPSAEASLKERATAAQEDITKIILRCLDSARSAVASLPHVHLLGSTYLWNVLYFPATASVALALRILVCPGHPRAKADLAMVHETVDFLTKASSQEPGTYIEYMLGVLSDLESAAKRALAESQKGFPQRPLASADTDIPEVDMPADRNKHLASHIGPATFPVSSNGVSAANLRSSDPTNNPTHEPFQDDLPALDTASDTMNWQWSISPLWNWQDIMTSMPMYPVVPIEEAPEDPILEF